MRLVRFSVVHQQLSVIGHFVDCTSLKPKMVVPVYFEVTHEVEGWALKEIPQFLQVCPSHIYNMFTVVSYQKMKGFHQNESYLGLSFFHNSREDGSKKGSSHFEETLSFGYDTAVGATQAKQFSIIVLNDYVNVIALQLTLLWDKGNLTFSR